MKKQKPKKTVAKKAVPAHENNEEENSAVTPELVLAIVTALYRDIDDPKVKAELNIWEFKHGFESHTIRDSVTAIRRTNKLPFLISPPPPPPPPVEYGPDFSDPLAPPELTAEEQIKMDIENERMMDYLTLTPDEIDEKREKGAAKVRAEMEWKNDPESILRVRLEAREQCELFQKKKEERERDEEFPF